VSVTSTSSSLSSSSRPLFASLMRVEPTARLSSSFAGEILGPLGPSSPYREGRWHSAIFSAIKKLEITLIFPRLNGYSGSH
jgi:hypothetical protein